MKELAMLQFISNFAVAKEMDSSTFSSTFTGQRQNNEKSLTQYHYIITTLNIINISSLLWNEMIIVHN